MAKIQVCEHNFRWLERKSGKRIRFLWGGAGSGKSWAIAQYLVIKKLAVQENIKVLIVRKTGPSLRKSCWALVRKTLCDCGIPFTENKQDNIIQCGNGNEIIFMPLDDIEKIKSIEGINYIWVEEANEITHKEFIQLNLRCRGKNVYGINEILVSFNPILTKISKYLKKMVQNLPDNAEQRHSTYLDNPFLDKEYIKVLNELKNEDKTYHLIYALGEWALPSNLIYENWEITRDWPEDEGNLTNLGYGLDFGYNAPTSLILIGWRDERTIYEKEMLYERRMSGKDLIDRLKLLIPEEHRHRPIVADSASPDRIDEILDAGFNIWPCVKYKNSITDGITLIKSFKTMIYHKSVNLIEEKSNYKWKEDASGEPLDAPVEFNDHLLDAERYYVSSMRDSLSVLGIQAGVYDIAS